MPTAENNSQAGGFIVTLEHNGEPWPLRGTVWAFRMERAQVFDTREAAQAQLDKARKFMPAKLYRAARIVSTPVDPTLMSVAGECNHCGSVYDSVHCAAEGYASHESCYCRRASIAYDKRQEEEHAAGAAAMVDAQGLNG
jgi:hypothetical protein